MSAARGGRPTLPVGAAAAVLGTLVALLASTAMATGVAAAPSGDPTTTMPPQGGLGTLAPLAPGVTEQTEVYRTVDGRRLVAEVHRPAAADGTRPVVVLLHGGGWYSGQPSDMDTWADLLADAGWVTVSLEYRLAAQGGGQPSWPEAFEDVQAGIEWVHTNAASLGADPARLAVFGESAGAHLAVLAAVEGTGGDARIAAVAAWSPPLDLAPLAPVDGAVPGCSGNRPCEEFWSIGVVEWFLGCAPTACADAYADASPLGRVGASTAPLWVANSTEELVPLPPARQLDQQLGAAGVEHQLRVVPGSAHAHGYGQAVWNDMVPWMADRLGVEAPDPAPFPGASAHRPHVVGVAVGAGVAVLVLALAVAAVHERRHGGLP